MERLMLDIVGVVVAVGVDAEVGVLDCMEMSWVTPTLGFEFVKGMGGVRVEAKKGL
jgi:hypothetical protein